MTAWRKIRAATVTGLLAFVALFAAGNAFAQDVGANPTSLTLETNFNNEVPSTTITLTNSNATQVRVLTGYSSSVGWMQSTISGTTIKENGGTQTLTLKFVGTKVLDANVYNATIHIVGNGGVDFFIPVTLTVVHPIISPSLSRFNASCDVRKNPEAIQTFTVGNGGNGELSFSAEVIYLTGGSEGGLVVSPATIAVSGTVDTPAADATIKVTNNSSTAFTYSASSSVSWMTDTPVSGSIAAGASADVALKFDTDTTITHDAGNYSGTVTVSAPGMRSQTVAVTYTVVGPTLAVDQTSLGLRCEVGQQPVPASQTVTVWNSDANGTVLNVVAQGDVSWLWVGDIGWWEDSSTGPNDRMSFPINYDTHDLVPGSYTGHVTIYNEDTWDSVVLTVNLTVEAPGMVVNPATLAVSCLTGGTAADTSFRVFNAGVATTTYNVDTDVAWISVSPDSGSLDTGNFETIVLSFDTDTMAAGTYTGVVTTTFSGEARTTTVTLTIAGGVPTIAVSQASLNLSCRAGGSATQTVSLWNSDTSGTTLNYTTSEDASWLTLGGDIASNSTGPANRKSLTVTCTSATAGVYTAPITVTNTGNGSIATITVTFNVISTAAGADVEDEDGYYHQGIDKSIVDWLSVAPASGSGIDTPSHEKDVVVTLGYNAVNLPDSCALPEGVYHAKIVLHNTSTNLKADDQTIYVSLKVKGGWIYADPELPNNMGVLYAAVGENPVDYNGHTVSSTYFAVHNRDTADIVAQAPKRASNHGPITCDISTATSWLTVPAATAALKYRETMSYITVGVDTTALAVGDYTGVINLKDPYSANNKYTVAAGKAWYVKGSTPAAEDTTPRSAGVDLNVFLHVGTPSISLLVDTEEDNDEYVYQGKTALVNGRYGYDPDGNKIDDSIEIFAAWAGDAAKYTTALAGEPTDDTADSEYQGPMSFQVTNAGDGPLKYHIATTYHQSSHSGWITNATDLATRKTLLYRLDTFGDNTISPLDPETFNYTDTIDLTIDTDTARLPVGTYTATLSVVSDNVNPCATKNILVVLRVGPKVYIPDTLAMTINGVDVTDTNGVERDADGPVINLQASVDSSPTESRFFVMLPGKTSPGIDPLTGSDWDKYPTFCPDMTGAINKVDGSYSENANANQLSFSLQRGGYNTGAWMSFDVDSGTLEKPNNATCVKVSYDTTGMAAGTYTGYIFVNGRDLLGNDAANTSFTYTDPATPTITPDPLRDGNYIKVNLELVRPTILANPASITRSVTQGGSDAATFNISNRYQNSTLYYSLSVDYLTSQTGWLSVNPTSGSSTGPGDATPITVSYNTTGLKTGTHSANVVISSANASNAPLNVRVDIIVLGPSIGLAPTVLNPTCATGTNPATATGFKLWNAGTTDSPALNYNIADNVPWLSCSPDSGSWQVDSAKLDITVTYGTKSLMPGTYTGDITVTNTDDGTSKTIAVTLTVLGPQIAVDATKFDLTKAYGATAFTQEFNVWNANTTPESSLNFAITSDKSWLTIDSINPLPPADNTGSKHTVTLKFDTANMPVGTYSANVKISDSMASNSPITIPVTLQIRGSVINLSTSELNFAAPIGGDITSDSDMFTITNAGVAALNFTLGKNQSWLTLTAVSGPIAASGTRVVDVDVDPANLTAGNYSATVTVGATDGAASKTLTVNLTVTAPAIAVSQSSFSEVMNFGTNSDTCVFQVWNSDASGSALSYAVASDVSWMTITANGSGSSSGPSNKTYVSATLRSDKLAPGTYNGHLTVTSGKASNNPVTIPVTLTINGADISLDRSSLNPQTGIGGTIEDGSFRIVNSAKTLLTYTLSTNASWILFADSTGEVTANTTSDSIAVQYNVANVAAGTHSGSITVTGDDGTTVTLPVTLTIYAPTIVVSQSSLTQTTTYGVNPDNQTVQVWNGDSSTKTTLHYVLASSAAWLTVNSSSDTSTGPADRKIITLGYVASEVAKLAPGSYDATVSVLDANAANSPIAISVRLTVLAAKMVVSKTALTPACEAKDDAPDDTFVVGNRGSVDLGFTITSNVSWLSCDPDTGVIAADGLDSTVTVDYQTAALAAGTHTGVITVTSVDGTSSTIAVTLTVHAPTIAVDQSSLSPVAVLGHSPVPATNDLAIWNSDATGTTLDYTTSVDQTWMTLSGDAVTSHTSTGPGDKKTLIVTYATGGLAAGAYTGHIYITSGGATNSPLTITVNLTVSAAALVLSPSSINQRCAYKANPDPNSSSFSVTNAGSVSITYGLSSSDAWIALPDVTAKALAAGATDEVDFSYNATGLAAGSYSGHITVSTTNGVVKTIPVTLTVRAAAIGTSLGASLELDATCVVGSLPAPAARSIELWNADGSGLTTLNYDLFANQSWLTLSANSGSSTGPGDRQKLTITFNDEAKKLGTGTYTATLLVVAGYAANSPVTLTVKLTVTNAELTLIPPVLQAECAYGSNPAANGFFKILNEGGSPIQFNLLTEFGVGVPQWFSVSAPADSAVREGTATGTLNVIYDTIDLDEGTYTDTIVVLTTTGSRYELPVTTNVYKPAIATSVAALNQTGVYGVTPSPLTFKIWNSGNIITTLNYSIVSDQSWLVVTDSADSHASDGPTEQNTITVTFTDDAQSLSAGTHTANLTIIGANASNSPRTIVVTLEVKPPTIQISSPLGGETWKRGSTQSVSWTSNAGGLAKVDLYIAGTFLGNLADDVANNSSNTYSWTIAPTLAVSADYTVKITAKAIPISATSAAFAIVDGNYLLLTAPNGGETISNNAGSTYTITWLSNIVANATVAYSSDGGSSYTDIATVPATDGAYVWSTAGKPEGINYRVRLTCGAYTSASASNFTVAKVYYITNVVPAGGESWAANSEHAITWDTNLTSGNVKIELLKDDAVDTTIETVAAIDGTYSWTIPAGLAVGSTYKVKVSSVTTPTVYGVSAASFSIVAPYFTLTAPATGAIWARGDTDTILWESSGVTGNVKIELLKGGKLDGTTIPDTPAVSAGMYVWDIPDTQVAGNDYKIKVTSLSNPLTTATSGNFSIADNSPAISVTPDSFAVELVSGQTVVRQMAISNNGGWPLTWSIDDSYDSMNSNDQPDSVAYSWVEIAATGTRITGLGGDANVGPFDIGFSFPFYGQNCDTFRVCSNGWISFSSESTASLPQALPSAVAPANLVALFWEDLSFVSGGAAYYEYQTKADGDTLVVEFVGVPRSSDGDTITCELILKPSGEIRLQYKDVPSTVDTCAVGIQNADGTKGVQVCYGQAFLEDGLAVRLAPYWPALSALSGTVNPGETSNVNLTFSAVGLAAGSNYAAKIAIASNDPDTPVWEVPVTMKVVSLDTAAPYDFNGDSVSDLVFRSSVSGAMRIDLMAGAEIKTSGLLYSSGADWEMAGSGDLDRDGKADIILKNTVNGAYFAYLMNGVVPTDKGFLCQSSDTLWSVCAVADINGDGNQDIILRHSGTGAVYAWLMAGTEIASQGFLYEGADRAWEVAGLADLNGDGAKDLVLRNPANGALYAYLLDGLDCIGQGYIWKGGDANWKVAGFGRFNVDLKEDLLLFNDSTGDGFVYLMDGIAPVDGGYVVSADGLAKGVFAALADFDGDGKTDILLRDESTGALYIYLMDGALVTDEGFAQVGCDSTWTFAQCADFNGDGKADILLSHAADGEDVVYLMNGLSVIDSGVVAKDAPDWKLR